jgi:hypothetical protein
MRLPTVSRLIVVALVLGACATSTPQQSLAYDRWAKCGPLGATLQNVAVDGRVTFIFSNGAAKEDALQCLAQAGPDGARLPTPIAIHPAGGV